MVSVARVARSLHVETLRDPVSVSSLVCREHPQDGPPSPKRLSEPGSVRRGPPYPPGTQSGRRRASANFGLSSCKNEQAVFSRAVLDLYEY